MLVFATDDRENKVSGTRIAGILTGSNVWDLAGSPYWVEADVLIPGGSNLTIEAGVSVLVNGSHSITSRGNLTILGTKAVPVSVMPNASGAYIYQVISVEGGRLSAEGLSIINATISVRSVSDVRLRDISIEGPPDMTTMFFQDIAGLVATGVVISHSGRGNAVEGNGVTGLAFREFDITGGIAAGIQFADCQDCVIADGRIQSIVTNGLLLTDSHECTVSGVTVVGAHMGMTLRGNMSSVESSKLINQLDVGLWVEGSGNVVANNTVQGPGVYGIQLLSVLGKPTSGNLITGNTVEGAGVNGIVIAVGVASSDFNTVAYNTVESSARGVVVESDGNDIYGNILIGNVNGAMVTGASNHIYHNHFTRNMQQALDPGTSNQWDDGYPSGGNWWSDYSGTDLLHGPLQNLAGSDGIGDSPYIIDADSKDNYPFYYVPVPPPPRHVTARTSGFSGDVALEWEPPPLLSNGRYLIYTAATPTGFDFSAPNATVNAPVTTWSEVGAASWPGPRYYIVRALNLSSGAKSSTSNTAGKWTMSLSPGVQTFSLPLAPYPWVDYSQPGWVDTAQDFLFAMGAVSLAYMDGGTWVSVPVPGDPNHRLELGEGYMVRMAISKTHTFVGLPASMISYEESPPLWYAGFGQDDARRIWATAFDSDVRVSWIQPPGMMSMRDSYRVYYSPTRDGFFGIEGLDYLLLNGAPVIAPWGPIVNVFHAGALSSGREWYYMVIPFVNNSLQGSSSYSIGVFKTDLLTGYSAIGLPLRPFANGTYMDLDVSHILSPGILGVQWFNRTLNDWTAHAAWMPTGMYDTVLVMVMAVQVSADIPARAVFTGV
jgi:hypothetical protein